MNIQKAIDNVINKIDLSRDDMNSIMQTIMRGDATPAQIGGLLVALRIKGETVDEITAAAEVMRGLANKVNVDKTNLIDTCGTGGDATNTFNISTTSAFVVAASGAKVAKHGNRSVSSKSGSADVLEAAGIKIELNAEQVISCIENIGIGFMFAPMHHSAMKHAIGPRKELGIRTLFNVLGPLTNPASAPNQVIGVFDRKWLNPLAETLKQLGSKHIIVVHSEDGMDEISISNKTYIAELKDNEIKNYEITPDYFNIDRYSIDELSVSNINESLSMMKSVFNNHNNAAKAVVALNAGAAIYASGISKSMKEGVLSELIALGASTAINNESLASAKWLLLTYLFHTVGELVVSPIGLAAISSLSPKRFIGQMMGVWFLASSLGAIIAGLLSGQATTEGLKSMPDLFNNIAIGATIFGLILIVSAKPIHNWVFKEENK